MPEIKKDNESLFYEQSGNTNSTETLIFIHGATMTGAGMMPFAAQFPEYNCITVDLPGHGRSMGKTKETVGEFADSIFWLVDELQKAQIVSEAVTMIGFSMGGCITVESSLRKPRWLKRAVVLSSGACLKANTPIVKQICEMKVEDFRMNDLYAHLTGRDTTEEELALEMEVMCATQCEEAVGLSDLRTAEAYDRQAEVSQIEIPLFVAAGDDDKIVPVNIPIRLRDAVPGSELLVLPYRGHSAIYEETETVVKNMKSFFRYHPV